MNDKKPLFSIITIVWNDEENIERTLSSLKNQTYKNYEHIVVDGRSTDKTLDILKKHESDIDILISEKDNGVYDAMNKGLVYVNGEYVYFLNSGDTFYKNETLNNVAKKIKQNFENLYFGNVIIKDEKRGFRKKNQEKISLENLYLENFCHQSLFIKKGLFQKFGNFNTKYIIFADYEWNLRVLRNGIKPYYINEIISIFLIGGLSTPDNQKKKKIAYQEKFEIEKKYYNKSNEYKKYRWKSKLFSKTPLFIRNKIIHKGFHKNINNI